MGPTMVSITLYFLKNKKSEANMMQMLTLATLDNGYIGSICHVSLCFLVCLEYP